MAGEMLEFENGLSGMVMDIEKSTISAVLLGSFEEIHEGDPVCRTGKVMEVPVGEALIGRVVDAMGKPIDGRGALLTTETRPVESPVSSPVSRLQCRCSPVSRLSMLWCLSAAVSVN
jgi:F-type H+-transporting ATPase subunit alpha